MTKKYKESFYNIIVDTDSNGRKLVYNSISSAICWFTPEVFQTFSGKTNICGEELLPDIIRLGYCVEEFNDEYRRLEFERLRFIYNQQPERMEYIIAPTMKCNMNCIYCFENSSNEKNTMDANTANDVTNFIIKQIEQNKYVKTVYIRWFGGEPTLEINLIESISKKLIEYTESKNIVYVSTMITNGLLLNRKNAQIFRDECGIKFAQITLDGFEKTYSEMKGVSIETFHKVINNLVDINDVIKLNIRLNVTKKNCEEIMPLIDYLLMEKKLSNKIRVNVAHVRSYDYNNNDGFFNNIEFQKFYEDIMNQVVKRGYIDSIVYSVPGKRVVYCSPMQSLSTSIDPNGDLYRCECLLGRKPYIIGNCKHGFYRNDIDSNFLNYLIPNKCRACKYFPVCSVGCREEAIVEKKDVDCDAIKAKLKTDIKLYLYKKQSFNDINTDC